MGRYQPTDGGQYDAKKDDAHDCRRDGSWTSRFGRFRRKQCLLSADDEDESQEILIRVLDAAKINLQQGLAAGEQEGRPISAKFEVDEGKLQLSIYREGRSIF